MKIDKIDKKIYQYMENSTIDYVMFYTGHCAIYFCDGRVTEFDAKCETAYNWQYGLSVSKDDRVIFIPKYEYGLFAYDTGTGKLIWKLRCSRIREIHSYEDYIIARKDSIGLLKIDIDKGEIIDIFKAANNEESYLLDDSNIFVCYYGKGCAVVNPHSFEVLKEYPYSKMNVTGTRSFLMRNAYLRENDNGGKMLVIEAKELPLDKQNETRARLVDVSRVIDEDYVIS